VKDEISQFLFFLREYLFNKAIFFGKNFEQVKDLIVAFLLIKRGKYSNSFLNISFVFLVAVAIIAGPIIAQNNPFTSSTTVDFVQKDLVFAYDPYEGSPMTLISKKPEIIDYKVRSGDTLASVGKNFNVSVDSIKWSNDLKSDIIKPDQVLKIPPDEGVVHKVAVGESVYSIAKKYNVSAQNIVNFPMNEFTDYNTFALAAGQYIFVPGGKIIEKAVPAAQQYIAQIQAGVRGSSNFIWPTSGSITQYPVWYHMALDIANSSSPSILAADSGTVAYAGCIGWGYGCHIVIDHGNGYQTLYAHLSRYNVEVGQAVSQGQAIGIMGSTGRSTGTHLHFEVRSGGQLLNPLNFLK
jgi:murein DD-endopeptidase MepM/ murein hydrolase activator NlpD